MKLYSYFRSSASYRVRIALNLKEVKVGQIPVNLLKAEQKSQEFGVKNPQRLLPVLEISDGKVLTQSMAIMEYLDELFPDTHRLLPESPEARARVRAISQAIACEIAPINNLRVLNYLTQRLGVTEDGKNTWVQHWIAEGFEAVETILSHSTSTGKFCHGDSPTMADCCLVPQVFNARRFECNLTPYPTVMRIVESCEALSAFKLAHPSNQPDTPPN